MHRRNFRVAAGRLTGLGTPAAGDHPAAAAMSANPSGARDEIVQTGRRPIGRILDMAFQAVGFSALSGLGAAWFVLMRATLRPEITTGRVFEIHEKGTTFFVTHTELFVRKAGYTVAAWSVPAAALVLFLLLLERINGAPEG